MYKYPLMLVAAANPTDSESALMQEYRAMYSERESFVDARVAAEKIAGDEGLIAYGLARKQIKTISEKLSDFHVAHGHRFAICNQLIKLRAI